MTLRANTVEYAFATHTTALALATRQDLAAITVDIAENTSRTFRSAYVEVHARGNETSATSLTSWLIGVKIDAVAFSDATVTSTITNTGDQQSFVFTRDVTSYFSTNFTGTSHTVQVGVQFGAVPTINIAAKLVITYEYDDAAQTTRTKTVRIPIESGTTTLTNSLAEVGTNQIPQLTGAGSPFLPESTISVKDLFFEVMANEGHASGTTDDQLGLQIDAEAETLFGALEQSLDSSPWMCVFWKRTDLDTTAAHAFKARGTTTGRFPQLCAVMVVTYTYDHSASTTLLNSLMFALTTEGGSIGGTTSGNQSKSRAHLQVQEPTTIALKQSAVLLSFNAINVAITGLNVAVNGQTHRAYTPLTALGSPAGQHTLMHRFDSGGAAGSGLTIARGENTIDFAIYRTSAAAGAVGGGATAVAYLNYTSGKASGGAGAHNHTTLWLISPTAPVGNSTVYDTATFAPVVPESSYWTNTMCLALKMMHAGRGQVTIAGEQQTGEDEEDGWHEFKSYALHSANEMGVYTPWIHAPTFDRHPGDLDTDRLAVETSRLYRISTFLDPGGTHGGWASLGLMMTYHSIGISAMRAITGYAGDGSGIVVTIHHADTGEAFCQATSAVGGGYTFTAYDDTTQFYAVAQEDGTHVGRSADFTAS
jgi:hypothetical protein